MSAKTSLLTASLLTLTLAFSIIHVAPAMGTTALGLHLTDCTIGHSKAQAECGTFGVYENRASRSGRIVRLSVVVLKAAHPTHRAIAFVPGGPGSTAVFFAPLVADGAYVKALTALHDRYNILFVDSRGMGGSAAFACNFVPAENRKAYFWQLFPDTILSACRAKSIKTKNLNFYNTVNAVDDLDDARNALHYPKLVLSGGSYGSFFSLVYIRRHPNRVSSAILDGVTAPHFQPIPGSPDGAQAALNDLIVKCQHDRTCNTHFPDFKEHFNSVMARFNSGSVRVPLKTGRHGNSEMVPLSKEVFVDRLRQALYDPQNAATVPFVIERAYHGDYVPVEDLVDGMTRALAQAVDWAAFLSYTCADEMPFISEREVRKAATSSFAGDVRFRAQQHACSIWNVAPMASSFDAPVRSDLPILMITGSDDPTTPPQSAKAALQFLPNARQVIVRGAGHATETPCTDTLIVEFVRADSAKQLDVTRCNSAFTTPPFATSN